MKLAAWIYYIIDRRLGTASRFERLYKLDKDPFGCETYTYEQEKYTSVLNALAFNYSHILDIGCGTGVLTRLLAQRADMITAIDFSPKAIEIARANPYSPLHILYECRDIRRLNLHQKHDLIVCSEVLYYLTPEEIDNFCRSISDSQAPGTSIVTVGKMEDNIVFPQLSKHFHVIKKLEFNTIRRPYSITIYEI